MRHLRAGGVEGQRSTRYYRKHEVMEMARSYDT